MGFEIKIEKLEGLIFRKSLNQIPDISEVLTDKKDDFVESCVSSCSLLFFWVGALTPTEIGGECS